MWGAVVKFDNQPCLPSLEDSQVPVRTDVIGHWLLDAEKHAGQPKLNGAVWHGYRRGWADHQTLLKCYQQADDETLLEVMTGERKRDKGEGAA
jgi:hypothetical protein